MNNMPAPHTTRELSHHLLRCLLQLSRRLRNSKAEDRLPAVPLQVLGILYQRQSATATELAVDLGIKKQSLTLLISMLYEKRYITRGKDTDDARRITLSITSAGRKVFLKELGGRRELLARLITENLSEFETVSLSGILPILEKLAFDSVSKANLER